MTAESTPFVSLITGAASGLGWEITQRLYSRGDTVVLVDMNAELLATRERELGASQRVITCCGDLTQATFRRDIVQIVEQHLPRPSCVARPMGSEHCLLAASPQLSRLLYASLKASLRFSRGFSRGFSQGVSTRLSTRLKRLRRTGRSAT